MSKKPDASAAKPEPKLVPRETDPALELALKTLIGAKDTIEGREMALMTAGGAQMLVAYLLARQDELPKDIVAYAKAFRAQNPMAWKPLQGMNYIGFAKAITICGLGAVDHVQLQNACTELASQVRLQVTRAS